MKKLFVLLMPLCLSAGSLTMTGWISDAACSSGNAGPEPAKRDCAKRCLESGEAAVFVNDGDQKVFRLANAPKAKEHLATKVKVTGEVKGDLIQVTSIEDVK